ncbi:hypothetical protein PHYBOEH_010343 [Phytophthora boehmeriae]|uniref:Uncharacterized protein n=1 Tax=Phytophthora boehmeriae TaxID=109152 RepID=A0A8T1X4J6_9STRA|nr:hypothetical protein PHYBOEH_010343 [Phytophthora boehmeriae]
MSSDRDQNGASVTITAICINEVTGDIIVASGMRFGVYDVNGVLRVCLDDSVVSFHDPAAFSRTPITSLAVNRGEECEWSADKHIVTGYADGTLRVWAYSQAASPVQEEPRSSKSKQSWSIELQGQHRVESGSAITAVCVTPDKSKLYTGTQDGQLIQWTVGSSPSR